MHSHKPFLLIGKSPVPWSSGSNCCWTSFSVSWWRARSDIWNWTSGSGLILWDMPTELLSLFVAVLTLPLMGLLRETEPGIFWMGLTENLPIFGWLECEGGTGLRGDITTWVGWWKLSSECKLLSDGPLCIDRFKDESWPSVMLCCFRVEITLWDRELCGESWAWEIETEALRVPAPTVDCAELLTDSASEVLLPVISKVKSPVYIDRFISVDNITT